MTAVEQQFHTIIMLVVITLVTPQPLVRSNLPDQHLKFKFMKMRSDYPIAQVRVILMKIWQFLWAPSWSNIRKFCLHPHNIPGGPLNRLQLVKRRQKLISNIMTLISVYHWSKLTRQFLRSGWLFLHHQNNTVTKGTSFDSFGGPQRHLCTVKQMNWLEFS
jgi:hypothetical protein